MLFSSMVFLWIFFPLVIGGNYLFSVLPFKSESSRISAKNIFLLASSLFFYAWGGIYYLLIMLSSIVLNYVGGFVLEKFDNTKKKKAIFIVIIVLNLAILFFFKYFNMLVVVIEALMQSGQGITTIINTMIGMQGTGALGFKHIVLPIGISFFTFQSMSYVIDVYMKKCKVQRKFADFALYVSLFPQLIAGPIVKYSDIDLQLNQRKETIALSLEGQKRFCYGLGKKVLISNTFAEIADKIWALDTTTLGAPLAWFGIIAYTLQIYYDFSGYSDMAIGIGKMLGFEFKENFDYPYTSLSVQEFWRRWHISLSSWFKEYIYIPLGGNRKGVMRTYLNLFVVFLLTGIWHGANFTFIVWGLIYAALLIIERLFLGKLLNKNPVKIFNWIYTMLAVMIGWVYFRSNTIFQANEYIKQMFSFKPSVHTSVLSYVSMWVIIALVIGVLFSGFVQRPLKSIYNRYSKRMPVLVADYSIQFVILVLAILLLVSGTYNPFIYFQF